MEPLFHCSLKLQGDDPSVAEEHTVHGLESSADGIGTEVLSLEAFVACLAVVGTMIRVA